MAVIPMNKIEDFSDLGQPIQFKYNNEVFSIPAVTPRMARKLIKISREITKKAESNDKKYKELSAKIDSYEEKNEAIPEDLEKEFAEIEEEMSKVFDFQLDFIIFAGLKKITTDNLFVDPDRNRLEEEWSNKLTSRIFKLINENMSDTEQEKK